MELMRVGVKFKPYRQCSLDRFLLKEKRYNLYIIIYTYFKYMNFFPFPKHKFFNSLSFSVFYNIVTIRLWASN